MVVTIETFSIETEAVTPVYVGVQAQPVSVPPTALQTSRGKVKVITPVARSKVILSISVYDCTVSCLCSKTNGAMLIYEKW